MVQVNNSVHCLHDAESIEVKVGRVLQQLLTVMGSVCVMQEYQKKFSFCIKATTVNVSTLLTNPEGELYVFSIKYQFIDRQEML
jgi:hypothetical protein